MLAGQTQIIPGLTLARAEVLFRVVQKLGHCYDATVHDRLVEYVTPRQLRNRLDALVKAKLLREVRAPFFGMILDGGVWVATFAGISKAKTYESACKIYKISP